MPSDHETASREQRVEALTKVIVSHQRIPTFDGSGRHRCSGCAHLLGQTDGPNSPRHAAHLADLLLDSSAIRDLLAEAKADALREAADDLASLRAFPWTVQRLRERAATTYRETSKEQADD